MAERDAAVVRGARRARRRPVAAVQRRSQRLCSGCRVRGARWQRIATSRTAAAACVALALEAGTRDNVTVVVCDCRGRCRSYACAGRSTREPTFYGAAAVRFTEGLESA